MKPYKFGAARGRRWPKIALFFGIAAAILFAGAALGVRTIYLNNLEPRDASAQEDITFVIETGATLERISKGLEQQEIIKASWAFSQYVRSKELSESFKAGTYRLKASMPAEEVAAVLTEGRVAMDLFTILPGKRLVQIKQSFLNAGFAEAEVDAALQPEQYKDHPALVDKPEGADLEGYLYPDSYQRIAETTPGTIIRQSLDEMAEALSPAARQGMAAQGLSVYEALILASIVEKEVSSNNPDDRPQAAQVFLSRLEIGMRLQSNATDDLPESYDTYAIDGLPPGPISNVTLSSINAVVEPAPTDYLYFVSGTDCVTRFSKTVQEHEALIQRHGVATSENRCT